MSARITEAELKKAELLIGEFDLESEGLAMRLIAEVRRLNGLVDDADRAVKLLLMTGAAQEGGWPADISGQAMVAEARAIADKLHAETNPDALPGVIVPLRPPYKPQGLTLMIASPASAIVHLLRHGRSLCGMPGVPADWPSGHAWVDDHGKKYANCSRCLQELAKPKATS